MTELKYINKEENKNLILFDLSSQKNIKISSADREKRHFYIQI